MAAGEVVLKLCGGPLDGQTVEISNVELRRYAGPDLLTKFHCVVTAIPPKDCGHELHAMFYGCFKWVMLEESQDLDAHVEGSQKNGLGYRFHIYRYDPVSQSLVTEALSLALARGDAN